MQHNLTPEDGGAIFRTQQLHQSVIKNRVKFGINNDAGAGGLCFGDAAGHREVSGRRQPLHSRLLQQLGVSGLQSHLSAVRSAVLRSLFQILIYGKETNDAGWLSVTPPPLPPQVH